MNWILIFWIITPGYGSSSQIIGVSSVRVFGENNCERIGQQIEKRWPNESGYLCVEEEK